MKSRPNRDIYWFFAPLYNVIFRSQFERSRRLALRMLDLQPGERLLIPGVGTGRDLPLIRPGVLITAVDLAPAVLGKARQRRGNSPNACSTAFALMDVQSLAFPEATFDAAYLSLILSAAADVAAAFADTWRTLRPGGRVVIFDRFVPESQTVTPLRWLTGQAISAPGVDPSRRLEDILKSVPGAAPEQEGPGTLRGTYRIVRLVKHDPV